MVDIIERIKVLFPSINVGADLSEADCVIVDGEISEWGRGGPQPTTADLEAVSASSIEAFKLSEVRIGMVSTPWQIRKALNMTNGSRTEVEALIAAAPQDTRDGWQYASRFERTNDLVIGLGVALGMTDTELDDLFILAATL